MKAFKFFAISILVVVIAASGNWRGKWNGKKGLYDIKLNKFHNYWGFNIESMEQHKEKQELIKKLSTKSLS